MCANFMFHVIGKKYRFDIGKDEKGTTFPVTDLLKHLSPKILEIVIKYISSN